MAKRRGRQISRRKPKRTIVLVVEGETELYYFTGLGQYLRSLDSDGSRPAIKKHHAGGVSPEHVVKTARILFETYGEPASDVHYIAVFDTEYPDPEKRKSFDQAVKKAKEFKISVVASHPCFEVWMYCHLPRFSPCAFNDAKDCVSKLDREWKSKRICTEGYTKAKSDVFTRVQDQLPQAVECAKTLRETHHRAVEHTADANASTDVYRLVEYLQGAIEEYSPFIGEGG